MVIEDNREACVGVECTKSTANANIRGSQNDSVESVISQHDNSNHVPSSNMEAKEPIHLVYAADDDGESIRGVEQSIRSVMHFASEPIVFHFIADSPLPSLGNAVKFYNLTEIRAQYNLDDFTNPKKRFGKKRKTLNSSLANYVRFVIDSLLPDASKAMWIDADTIVKCDIVPMVRNALTNSTHAVAAVGIKGKPQSLSRFAQSKYKHINQTFNAGVFVVDLNRWREQKLTQKIREISLLNKEKKLYRLGSQPPLTLAIGNNFEHLSPAWNVKVPLIKEYFKDYGNDANVCLLHWVGGRKPWDTKQNLRSTHKEWWNNYKSKKRITAKNLKVRE